MEVEQLKWSPETQTYIFSNFLKKMEKFQALFLMNF